VTGNYKIALKYAKHGVPVFPLVHKSKTPATAHGFLDATTDPKQIRAWWQAQPDRGIGGRMGETIEILDLDGPDSEAWFAELEAQHGPVVTPVCLTRPGRRHVLFQALGLPRQIGILGKGAPKVDVLGVGGYAVLPPSIHPDTGKPYRWAPGLALGAVPLAPWPPWLLEIIHRPNVEKSGTLEKNDLDFLDVVRNGVTEGSRNMTVASLSGHLLRRYIHPFVALELVLAWNTRNNPPLPEKEVMRTFDSISGREFQRRTGGR